MTYLNLFNIYIPNKYFLNTNIFLKNLILGKILTSEMVCCFLFKNDQSNNLLLC